MQCNCGKVPDFQNQKQCSSNSTKVYKKMSSLYSNPLALSSVWINFWNWIGFKYGYGSLNEGADNSFLSVRLTMCSPSSWIERVKFQNHQGLIQQNEAGCIPNIVQNSKITTEYKPQQSKIIFSL